MPKLVDRTGQRFTKLLVLRLSPERIGGRPAWDCQCDCGNTVTVKSDYLISKRVQSCGCLLAGKVFVDLSVYTSKHPLYRTYYDMVSRCYDDESANYHKYGERGIKVCKRWLGKGGFTHFVRDMGKKPEGMSLDRIRVNGHYTPSNCRWATVKTQQDNRRCTVRVVYQGKRMTLAELADREQLSRGALYNRVVVRGQSIAHAVTSMKT